MAGTGRCAPEQTSEDLDEAIFVSRDGSRAEGVPRLERDDGEYRFFDNNIVD